MVDYPKSKKTKTTATDKFRSDRFRDSVQIKTYLQSRLFAVILLLFEINKQGLESFPLSFSC